MGPTSPRRTPPARSGTSAAGSQRCRVLASQPTEHCYRSGNLTNLRRKPPDQQDTSRSLEALQARFEVCSGCRNRPPGAHEVSMLRMASTSPARVQLVMVECSAAGMEVPSAAANGMPG